MLERIYIDNYKCLVNFEYRPGKLQLLLGGNGSGKSTVFEVLGLLRAFVVDRAAVDELFLSPSRTRWETRSEQHFELEAVVDGKRYTYRLTIGYGEGRSPRGRVESEHLALDDDTVLYAGTGTNPDSTDHVLALFGGDDSSFLVGDDRSSLPLAASRAALRPFRDWVDGLHCIQINPYAMSGESSKEDRDPARDLSNFASWYRHLSQERPRVAVGLLEYLKPVVAGLGGFPLTSEGETARMLRAQIRTGPGKPVLYTFGELSEGQRVLVGLYTLLALMKDTPITLCIDEPDNFVALAEIQPWLMELQDVVEAHGSQVLIISHHPDILDYLAPRDAMQFSRTADGPTRVAPFAPAHDEPLTAAEIVRRGWEERAGGVGGE